MREIDIGDLQVVAGGNGVTTHTHTFGPDGYSGTTTTYTPTSMPQGSFTWSSGGMVFNWDTGYSDGGGGGDETPVNSDGVAYAYQGVSIAAPNGLTVGYGSYYTSDGRHFASVNAGITAGVPVLDLEAGYATNSDVFAEWGITTGAFTNATVSSSGGAFGVSGNAGTTISYGVETPPPDPNIVFVDGVSFYIYQSEP